VIGGEMAEHSRFARTIRVQMSPEAALAPNEIIPSSYEEAEQEALLLVERQRVVPEPYIGWARSGQVDPPSYRPPQE
jgi:hypothetical protein